MPSYVSLTCLNITGRYSARIVEQEWLVAGQNDVRINRRLNAAPQRRQVAHIQELRVQLLRPDVVVGPCAELTVPEQCVDGTLASTERLLVQFHLLAVAQKRVKGQQTRLVLEHDGVEVDGHHVDDLNGLDVHRLAEPARGEVPAGLGGRHDVGEVELLIVAQHGVVVVFAVGLGPRIAPLHLVPVELERFTIMDLTGNSNNNNNNKKKQITKL